MEVLNFEQNSNRINNANKKNNTELKALLNARHADMHDTFAQNGNRDKPLNYIYHTTHIKNIEQIVNQGLLNHNQADCQYDISNQNFNRLRCKREPFYGRQVHDYVPFYLNPRNAFMYSSFAKGRNKDLVIIAVNTYIINDFDVLLTDGNAALDKTQFTDDMNELNNLHKDVFADRWVDYDRTHFYDVKRRMMSEILVPESVPSAYFAKLIVHSLDAAFRLDERLGEHDFEIMIQPELFF